ncbi:MAG TPA: SURF1 family protein [Cellulomonas sp.]
MRVSSAALRRAAVLVAVGLLVAVTCTLLGRWQWNKHVARDASNATFGANWSAPAVPLASIAASAADEPARSDEWRAVAVTGHYLTHAGVLLRNRPVDGTPAYHVLVPFQVDNGAVLVVDRGWVPLGSSGTTSAAVPPPPAGTVDLVARLRMPEPPSDRSAPPGQVQNLDPGQVLAAGGLPPSTVAYRWYAAATSESPAPASAPAAFPTPTTDPGPYLSYAVQWWVFALAGLFAFCWMARREIVDELAGAPRAVPAAAQAQPAAPSPDVPKPATRRASGPPAAVRRRRGRDELAEDAFIDAQADRRR